MTTVAAITACASGGVPISIGVAIAAPGAAIAAIAAIAAVTTRAASAAGSTNAANAAVAAIARNAALPASHEGARSDHHVGIRPGDGSLPRAANGARRTRCTGQTA